MPWRSHRITSNLFILLTFLSSTLSTTHAEPDIGGGGTHGGEASHLDADDPDFSGVVDFSNAIPGPDGSWCITKTKYVDHMVKDQIKECWHQNVTQCHDTYVTEFLPSQEQKCEESFWKSCKIDFKEAPYNYTMKQCHIPLVKKCDPPNYSGNVKDAEIVCKTWFESECNTTFIETSPKKEDLPNTWCKKVPRKICAPDNCKMVPGPEQCNQKMMVSTIQKPSEVCDLQPQTHCRLITILVPHLIQKEVCRKVPKEMCHLALGNPHTVKKPMRLRWCTKKKPANLNKPAPQYKPSYLPPPPPSTRRPAPVSASTTYTPNFQTASKEYAPPSYSSPTGRPAIQFQRRSQQPVYETKFKPKLPIKADQQDVENPKNILIEDFFVQNSQEDLELITKSHAQPLISPKPPQENIFAQPQNNPSPKKKPTKMVLEDLLFEEKGQEEEGREGPKGPTKAPLFRENWKKRPFDRMKSKAEIPLVLPASITDDITGVGFGAFASLHEQNNDGFI